MEEKYLIIFNYLLDIVLHPIPAFNSQTPPSFWGCIGGSIRLKKSIKNCPMMLGDHIIVRNAGDVNNINNTIIRKNY
ncbi:MAG: hypothetical protein IH795_06025 [Bacteroidetes bacterium]|nr:hypothetical protein [Bacteroidota bacterium]